MFNADRAKKYLNKAVVYTMLLILVIAVLTPLLITVFASFKTPQEISQSSPLSPPSSLYLENYKTVIVKGKFFQGFVNSMILVVVSIVLNILIGSTTAYALNRFNFKLKKVILTVFVLGMVVPVYITEIARFGIINSLGLYNTRFAPILIYVSTDLLQLYIYSQFIEKIPVSLDESALIDGCSYIGIFFRIIFPLLLPATATLSIIKAVEIINDMYIPYLYMPSSSLRTLTTTLMDFSSAMFGNWWYLSAAIVLVALPTIAIYVFFQKYVFAGIVAGAVKE